MSSGRLKVFFGAAPGVGKTYAMLEAARTRHGEGGDVVIGWVETHGRAETAALADGLPRLPPREVEYRGIQLREFDLDAALARRPRLLLLDELAHTNAPGLRHAKRWQDALELLDAGIDVYTTLNVQHLESLNDLVNQVTGVSVRETVPDNVLDDADDVEFVDLAPEELLRRLAEGKVYLPERAAEAARHFFRRGNLLALRELALRRTAEHVDADVRDYRRDHAIDSAWPVTERILVCVRPNPESDRLVRSARRIAARLRAEWIVACVESDAQPALTESERRALAATMKLAEELGAETTALSGASVSEALLAFARQRNVSRIVVGKPLHARWRDRLKGSLLDEIVRGSGGVEVVVVPGGHKQAGGEPQPARPPQSRLSYAKAALVMLLCSLVCSAMFGRFDNSNLIMVYLLGVAFVATRYGRAPSAMAAVLGVALFDFFFVPPYLTFAVRDTQYLVTFAVMLVVSLLISTLAVRVKAHAEAASERDQRTQVLYAMSRELAAARTAADVAAVSARHVAALMRGSARVLLPDAEGRLRPADGQATADARDDAVSQWVFEHRRPAGLGTDTLPAAGALYLPLLVTPSVLGVLGVRPHEALVPLGPAQLDLLLTLARQVASALERVRFASEAETARVSTESERLRNALLSSVSHDLRTPLGVIQGAASTLLDAEAALDGATRADLIDTIREESDRLNRRVRNLLDMTRLEAGAPPLDIGWESLEEIVGASLERVEGGAGARRISVRLPPALPLVACDGALVELVLVNLLENALKYAPDETPIEVSAVESERELILSVKDEGPGIPEAERERVFEKFYRTPAARGAEGVGLGLAICRAVVRAHNGRIWVENRPAGGAAFHVALPRAEPPPPPPEELGE
jgi:two-component system sensor histidine kinase KdpD